MSWLTKAFVFILFAVSANAQSIIDRSISGPASFTETDIRNELAKYPPGLVQALIDKIAITDGKGGLALRCHREIRLSASSSLRIMKIQLHHEFSSFVLYRGKCDDSEAVRKVNEIRNQFLTLNGDFGYDMSNESQAWKKLDESSDLGQHFYNVYYAMTNFENDFNIISESLFTDGEKVLDFLTRNADKPVGRKIELVIDFYQSVDVHFSKEYFRSQKL